MSAKMGHRQHLWVWVTTNERTSANGGGRPSPGKVQFYAGDLTGISASQPLSAGKVSPLKLDLTGIELCAPRHFSDFDISSSNVKKLIENRYGPDFDLSEMVVAPIDLFNSVMLEEVHY